MAITTYKFYTETFYGETIEGSCFSKWVSRAEDKLNVITCGNITEETVEMYSVQIQKASCAISDLLYEIDKAEKAATAKDATNIKSMSSGGESVTYGDNQTTVTKVLSDRKAQNRLLYEAAAEYLTGTGLLYAGY